MSKSSGGEVPHVRERVSTRYQHVRVAAEAGCIHIVALAAPSGSNELETICGRTNARTYMHSTIRNVEEKYGTPRKNYMVRAVIVTFYCSLIIPRGVIL